MSSTCIYKEFAIRIPAEEAGQPDDQFILISLVGSSNSYDWSGRRSRRWTISGMGSREDIVAYAIYYAGGFERSGTCFGNFGKSGAITPDAYIAKVRRMMDRALELDSNFCVLYGNMLLQVKAASGEINKALIQKVLQEAAESSEPDRKYAMHLLVAGPKY